MKLIICALIALSIAYSCSSPQTELTPKNKKEFTNINPILKPYVVDFINESDNYVTEADIKDLTVGFKKYDMTGDYPLGVCWYLPNGNEITINEDWWNNKYTKEINRKSVMFHELGHCILYRPHSSPIDGGSGFVAYIERFLFWIGFWADKGYLKDDCPISLMHPRSLSAYCLNKHWEYYRLELFHNSYKSRYINNLYTPADNHNHSHYILMKKCKEPQKINNTKVWNKQDQKAFDSAKVTCRKTYVGCLKLFTKKSEGIYTAICD